MGSSQVANLQINRMELTEVYCPDKPQVDIVFVHGLNGHPQKTWTAKNGVFWPAQLLPRSLGSCQARILVYGYNADVYAFGGKSPTSDYIHEHAQTLVVTLDAERYNEEATERPIIFVAHSLGGILVKRALEYSWGIANANTLNLRSIFVSTYGILFLGTPHNGADPAKWGSILQSMCGALLPKKLLDSEPQLVTALKTQSETLQNINLNFVNIMDKFHIYFFHEAVKTNFGVTQDFVVEQTSASPIHAGSAYAGIEATHSEMCKFESKNSPGYTAVSSTLKRFSSEAPSTIAHRWIQERIRIERAMKDQASELLGPYGNLDPRWVPASHAAGATPQAGSAGPTGAAPSPDVSSLFLPHPSSINLPQGSLKATEPPSPASEPAVPLFIVPPGFRPNSIFIGMDKELKELDSRLFDPNTRARGSACVLLWCLSGGGKSHLARQYLYHNKDKFPGGVFWVRAKTKDEIARDYWDIAQKAALKDVQDPRGSRVEEVTETFVNSVKTWFEEREGWLLVFDGITIEQEAHKTSLQSFIPDSKNSSVIFTSVDKSLAGSHRLLNPSGLKIHPLTEAEATTLLFQELEIKNPSKVEIERATALVRDVDRLPLAIHAIGHRLRNTGEPLVKYHVRPYSSDQKLREPFQEIMADLHRLNHVEAENLVNILCFFGQHIPFEMVHLGLKGLHNTGINVRARERGGRPDLNNTLALLLRYALIDRNDPDDTTSQGSHPSLADTIDILKIHSVVQSFLCERLKAADLLHVWLGYAIRVFCASYVEADIRIKSKEGAGLVKDYREYEVHGKRLLEHVKRNKHKNKELKQTRTDLESILAKIKDEIQKRTPGASQEAAVGAEPTHRSVFDRTSSTSDTGPETPGRTTSDLSFWGVEPHKPHTASPIDASTASFPPFIVTQTPLTSLLPYENEDDGYLSDMEAPNLAPYSAPPKYPGSGAPQWPEARRKLSEPKAKQDDPQVHRTVSKMKQRRYRDSVSSWRFIKPTIPDPSVSGITAERVSVPRPPPPSRANMTGTSEAEIALAAVHRGSPPPRGGGRISDRRDHSRGRGQGTVPDVLNQSRPSGDPMRDRNVSVPRQQSPVSASAVVEAVTSSAMHRDGSAGTSRSGSRYATPPPNLSLFRPPAGSSPSSLPEGSPPTHFLATPSLLGSHPSASRGNLHDLCSSLPDLSTYHRGDIDEPNNLYRALRPQENTPYPLETESITAVLHGSPALGAVRLGVSHGPSKSLSSMRPLAPVSERTLGSYPASGRNLGLASTRIPLGYSSQPMSREGSGQVPTSPHSLTGTEPSRFPPPLSPPIGSSPLAPQSRVIAPAGPATGKAPPDISVQRATPYLGAEHDFNSIGHWSQPSMPAAQTTSMSSSASGPGFTTGSAFFPFGDPKAMDVDLAALRAEAPRQLVDEGALDSFHHALGRTATRPPRSVGAAATVAPGHSRLASVVSLDRVPYPAETHMPVMDSDLKRLDWEDDEARGRRRGASSPVRPGSDVGLGLHFLEGPHLPPSSTVTSFRSGS